MKKLIMDLELLGPLATDLFDEQGVWGIGVDTGRPDKKKITVYYIVSDATAIIIALKSPPGTILETITVNDISEEDQRRAREITACTVFSTAPMPDIVLDFTE